VPPASPPCTLVGLSARCLRPPASILPALHGAGHRARPSGGYSAHSCYSGNRCERIGPTNAPPHPKCDMSPCCGGLRYRRPDTRESRHALLIGQRRESRCHEDAGRCPRPAARLEERQSRGIIPSIAGCGRPGLITFINISAMTFCSSGVSADKSMRALGVCCTATAASVGRSKRAAFDAASTQRSDLTGRAATGCWSGPGAADEYWHAVLRTDDDQLAIAHTVRIWDGIVPCYHCRHSNVCFQPGGVCHDR
jgi:hypothetical protein